MTVEPGRHVAAGGRIVYHWPPEGRFAALWQRIEATLPSYDDKEEAAVLLLRWLSENGTDVGYEEDGVWYDTEPDWHVPTGWLNPGPAAP
ncbi:MAG: hypothetical protein WKF86_00040 [Acidimicrobiales bacterium]